MLASTFSGEIIDRRQQGVKCNVITCPTVPEILWPRVEASSLRRSRLRAKRLKIQTSAIGCINERKLETSTRDR